MIRVENSITRPRAHYRPPWLEGKGEAIHDQQASVVPNQPSCLEQAKEYIAYVLTVGFH
ncbi:predicted protein [Plenodomus lingam JN3]|uniref:Predicted protein n=1 Tax=Leptosphaeria maculans (strain JN3 / isolate v23.1.3 / race Av1-4-5-6-7-8) TaxID=985895 RepID=E5ADE7_LEPMJ|nr:predicted protein [Plenodomus lingam JN3]CBY01236.1 predicted protein [Plenodomus lingam JN3]